MTTEVTSPEDRYVVDPEVDCLVVPTAPEALITKRRYSKSGADTASSSSINSTTPRNTPNSSIKKKSSHERKKKKDKSRHSSSKSKERRAQRDEYKKKGDTFFQNRQYEEAIEEYTMALALDPTSHIILSNRSAAHYKNGDKTKALYDAQAAVDVNPTFTTGFGRLAVTLQKMKKWEAALEAYMKVLELDPSNTMAQRGVENCAKKVDHMESSHHRRRRSNQTSHSRSRRSSNQSTEDEQRRFSMESRQSMGSTASSSQRPRKSFPKTAPTDTSSVIPSPIPSPPTTPSNLSELSQQLRVVQAINEAHKSQIERLERQLRIVSDLKGISVTDLRCELQEACKDHAHADLQAQVTSLRAQLDAVQRQNNSVSKDVSTFEQESASKTIATLQLRVGEAEEMENALREENRRLYRSLRDETSKVSLLSATCEHQREHIEELLNQQPGEEKKDTANTSQNPAQEVEQLQHMLRNAELEVRIQTDRTNSLENEAKASEDLANLRKEQFNCRMNIQDERIKDLEQQLSSLYAACEMLREEGPANNSSGDAPETPLRETATTTALSGSNSGPELVSPTPPPAVGVLCSDTDAQVARDLQEQINNEEAEQRRRSTIQHAGGSMPTTSLASLMSPIPHFSQVTGGQNVPMTNAWNNARDAVLPEKVVSGFLWKLDTDVLSGWRKQYFVLQGNYGNYHLSYSEGPRQRVRCELGLIKTGVSTVSRCTDFGSEQPHALVLHMDPHDPQATVLYAAASSKQNLDKWYKALALAAEGQVAGDAESVGCSAAEAKASDLETAFSDLETALNYQKMEYSAMSRRHSCY